MAMEIKVGDLLIAPNNKAEKFVITGIREPEQVALADIKTKEFLGWYTFKVLLDGGFIVQKKHANGRLMTGEGYRVPSKQQGY